MGLFRKKIDKHKDVVLEVADNVVAEDARTYRNQVGYFSDRYRAATVSPRGLVKAQLFGLCFAVWPLMARWGEEGRTISEQISESVVDLGEALAADEAGAFVKNVLDLVALEVRDGPSMPGAETDAFHRLVEISHSVLLESVDEEHYSAGARDHFEVVFRGAVSARMKIVTQLIEAMA